MKFNRSDAGRRMMNPVRLFSFLMLVLALSAWSASLHAQSSDAGGGTAGAGSPNYVTLYLSNSGKGGNAQDIVTDLRNMLPRAKVYYIPSQNAVSILGTPDEIKLAQKILADVDRTGKLYRLTYMFLETDGGQSLKPQQVSFTVVSGGTTTFKQGSRVPVVTGTWTSNPGGLNPRDEFQYLDVGLNIQASLEGSPDHLILHSKIEQSSVAEEKSGMGAQDPVIHQTTLDGASTLEEGKPVRLGSLDIPGTSRHMIIEVHSEPAL